jgi:hypothetical protein
MHPGIASAARRACLAAMRPVWTAFALGLAGCAAVGSNPGSSASEPVIYVGVFNGEFVDGMPLYRFPPIYVVGSRRSAAPDL